MLVLSRKQNEEIVIDGGIRITIVGISANRVRIGIEAPAKVGVFREELIESRLRKSMSTAGGRNREASRLVHSN